MFATLGGSLPAQALDAVVVGGAGRDAGADAGRDARDILVRAAVAAQVSAGLELVSDGGVRYADLAATLLGGLGLGPDPRAGGRSSRSVPSWRTPILVTGWEFAAGCTDRAVKQVMIGPYSLGRMGVGNRVVAMPRRRLTLAIAEALNAELHALAGAGCPFIEVVEDAATTIGDDPAERRLYRDAQRRLLAGLDDVHVSLAVRGGNADGAGAGTILDASYRSYLFDLCAGPDNWRLVVDVPGDRGVIVGAADAASERPDKLELLAFAIGYAASTRGRGHERVGLAISGDMSGLPAAVAVSKMAAIGEAARLYASEPGSLARAIDPRAANIRSAALGTDAPAPYDPASPARLGNASGETPRG